MVNLSYLGTLLITFIFYYFWVSGKTLLTPKSKSNNVLFEGLFFHYLSFFSAYALVILNVNVLFPNADILYSRLPIYFYVAFSMSLPYLARFFKDVSINKSILLILLNLIFWIVALYLQNNLLYLVVEIVTVLSLSFSDHAYVNKKMIKKNHLIYSVCKKNKFGLLDIANSLVMYGTRIDPERKYKIIVTFASAFIVFYQQFLSLINLRATEKVTFIIWDNSLFTLCIAFIARFSSINIIYYYHEPGGIKHKLSLNASLSYSILASLIENIFISLSSRVAVSQKDKLLYADFYLPLLYSDIRPNHLHGNNIIGYIGKLKGERMPDLLLQLESELKKQGYTIEYFPSKSNGTSQTDKFDFLSKCGRHLECF